MHFEIKKTMPRYSWGNLIIRARRRSKIAKKIPSYDSKTIVLVII